MTCAFVSTTSVRLLATKRPIKILIVVNSEEPTGVAKYWTRNLAGRPKITTIWRVDARRRQRSHRRLRCGGSNGVFVNDNGFRDQNLLPDRIVKRAKLLPVKPSLLHRLDDSFGGVKLVGVFGSTEKKGDKLRLPSSYACRDVFWLQRT